jgi:DNA-binding NarL/FixJ family response regulator
MTDTIRVMIVDDHVIVRRGLRDLLSTVDDIDVVGEAGNGEEALAVAREIHPHVVLMDLSMPVMDGVTATRRLLAEHEGIQIVALTSFADRATIHSAIDAGAIGYLLKHNEPDAVIDAVRTAFAGGSPLDAGVARSIVQAHREDAVVINAVDLTARETEVLKLVAEGLANKHIARKLEITERTVKAHLTHIFQRLNVTDRTQAALWARDHLT